MARRNPASTMALLQKASTQLRGERVQTKKNTDEDDIEAYLSTLSKRTTDQQKKSTKFEEMGDISISTSEDTAPKIHETTKVINNKFLKKTPVGRDQNEMGIFSPKQQMTEKQFLKGSQSAVSKTQRKADVMAVHKTGAQGSSALNKAAALTNRITQRAGNVGRSIARLETESDDSLSTTRDKSRPKSVSEDSLKKDGRKFLKKAKAVETPPEEIPARPSTPARHAVRDHKYRTSRSFTSEDESLAGFMDEFSKSEVSSSPKRSPQPPRYGRSSPMSPLSRASTPDSKPPRSPSPSLSPRASYRPSSPKRWSPGQRNLRRSHSDSSIVSDSMASDIADGSSDDGFKINVMDIDALEPIIDTKEILREKSKNKRSKSKEDQEDSSFKAMSKEEKQSVFKSRGKKKKQEPKESRSIFRSFGLQTVDDLFSKSSDNNIDQTESSVISEIKTERSTGRFSKKRRGDSFSEIASVPDEYSPRQQSYSEDFEESISERIGVSSDTNKPPTSGSEIKTQYSRSGTGRDYSDDFVSDDETIITESYSTRRTSESSYYDSYISDTETITRSADSQRDKKYVSTQDMEVQTEGGLLLNGGFAMRTPAYGLGFVDPTPIATHVVSADALEAMTAYSPTMIALHDMLRMQLDLTNQFIESQKLMYSSYVDTIESNFKYTSLESTKKYIEKHRKPKLTFKQALKQVSKEMNR